MNVSDAVKGAIYSRLSTDATLLSLLGSAKIYDRIAPQTVSAPYVIFAVQADTTDTSDPQRKEDVYVLIKGVTTMPARTAGAIAEHIDALMDGAPLTLAGQRNFWLRRTEGVEFVESNGSDGQYAHRGAIYRVRVAYS